VLSIFSWGVTGLVPSFIRIHIFRENQLHISITDSACWRIGKYKASYTKLTIIAGPGSAIVAALGIYFTWNFSLTFGETLSFSYSLDLGEIVFHILGRILKITGMTGSDGPTSYGVEKEGKNCLEVVVGMMVG